VKTWAAAIVSVMLAFSAGSDLGAQEKAEEAKKGKPAAPARFFDRPIDYWGRGLGWGEEPGTDSRRDNRPDEKQTKKAPGSDWGQVVKLPDGTLSYHELPGPLVQVLENPTPDSIRAYFEWRMERAGKVLRAAQLMKEYRAQALGTTPDAATPRESAGAAPPGEPAAPAPAVLPAAPARQLDGRKAAPFIVTYFHKKHCPHCDTEDAILTEWLAGKPEGRLEVIEFGMKPELWRAIGVRGTPSLLLEDGGTKKSVFLEGVSRADVLDRALAECRRAEPRETTAKGEQGK